MNTASTSSRRPGRPRLERDQQRGQRVTVRLRSKELDLVRALATFHGISVAELLRRSALGRKLRSRRIPAVNLACVGELNHWGRNLNQLLVLVHTGRAAPELETLLDRLLGQLNEVREQLVGAERQEPKDRSRDD